MPNLKLASGKKFHELTCMFGASVACLVIAASFALADLLGCLSGSIIFTLATILCGLGVPLVG